MKSNQEESAYAGALLIFHILPFRLRRIFLLVFLIKNHCGKSIFYIDYKNAVDFMIVLCYNVYNSYLERMV